MTQFNGREPRISDTNANEKGKRRLSLRRLGTMLNILSPDVVALDAVSEMIQSEDFFVRYNAAKLLSKRGDRDARLVAEDALKTGSSRARASVARHLHGFSWFSAEPMIKIALADSDSRVREAVIYTLCDLKDMNAYKLMLEHLPKEEDNVLEAAAFGLRETQDPAALPVLNIVLQSKDADVRIKALEALGMTGLREAMTMVREKMFDPEPSVKYAATLSLLELAGEDWLSELAGVIGRTNGETLEQVLLAFFHATNYLKIDVARSKSAELIIDALETALLDSHKGVRMAAVWSLAWTRHPRASNILKKSYIIETDSEVKAHIVRVAVGLMSDVSDEILNNAINENDDVVRKTAQKIVEERERLGFVPTFDPNAYAGEAFDRSHLTGKLS